MNTDKPYGLWIPFEHGKWFKTFSTLDEAHLFLIKYGGGLEIIKNTYESF